MCDDDDEEYDLVSLKSILFRLNIFVLTPTGLALLVSL